MKKLFPNRTLSRVEMLLGLLLALLIPIVATGAVGSLPVLAASIVF